MTKFYIVTPTYNSFAWLQGCIRSVYDQAGDDVHIHHHIQDARSSDGTVAWLEEWQREHQGQLNYHFTFITEKDEGMYDAINRAWALLPEDADIVAHINSDEQYQAHALARVAQEMKNSASADILLGSYIILDSQYQYICHRRPIIPRKIASWMNCVCITNSTFYRASSFRKHSIAFDTKWKCSGDLVLFYQLVCKELRFQCIDVITSTFLCTGDNLAWSSKAHAEWRDFHRDTPQLIMTSNLIIYRWTNLKRLVADCFYTRPSVYSTYELDSPHISTYRIMKPTSRWGARMVAEKGACCKREHT